MAPSTARTPTTATTVPTITATRRRRARSDSRCRPAWPAGARSGGALAPAPAAWSPGVPPWWRQRRPSLGRLADGYARTRARPRLPRRRFRHQLLRPGPRSWGGVPRRRPGYRRRGDPARRPRRARLRPAAVLLTTATSTTSTLSRRSASVVGGIHPRRRPLPAARPDGRLAPGIVAMLEQQFGRGPRGASRSGSSRSPTGRRSTSPVLRSRSCTPRATPRAP